LNSKGKDGGKGEHSFYLLVLRFSSGFTHSFLCEKASILSELAKLLKISVTDGYKGMGFHHISQ
jgi:hypothetical protein